MTAAQRVVDDEETRKLFEESWPKNCACGSHITEDAWERLRYVGVQKSGLDNYPDLELRECDHCKSTIAIVVSGDFVE